MNCLLIAFALLCAAAVCQAHVETGTIDCGSSKNWASGPSLQGRSGVKSNAVNVKFSRKYSRAPKVYVSFSELDVNNANNLRVTTQLDSVTASGFQASCITWFNSEVFSMKLNWISVFDYDTC